MDQRRDSLALWASTALHHHVQHHLQQRSSSASDENITRDYSERPNLRIEMVSGDASFRRYFRIFDDEKHWIAVDAPADKENNPQFVGIANQWRQHGVAVPEVLAYDFEQGFMLLEDFGDAILWPALHQPNLSLKHVQEIYRPAVDELLMLASLPTTDLPLYDATVLRNEMALFTDWLCVQQLDLILSESEKVMLNQVFDRLVASALSQPQVTVHRDYHSRNLMLCPDGRLGVIDFQDAMRGPLTYDLVSLLRDCYVRWPESLVDDLFDYWYEQYSSLIDNTQTDYSPDHTSDHTKIAKPTLRQAFDWMGMQRHLKAAGIFARLNLRDGKDGYLKSIPNTCQYLCEVSASYEEFAELNLWLNDVFMPRLNEVFSLQPQAINE
ncbi:MAG: phosphotransferase [Oleibacter sp.]|nr:phosphotransferase [Thalassolituus sp.]